MEPQVIDIYIQKSKSPITCPQSPNCILMQNLGLVERSLFSKLCGEENAKTDLLTSVVNCGQYSFRLIGLLSIDSHIIQRNWLRGALTLCPLSTIFIVLKYENNFDKLLQSYLDQQQLIYQYDHKIVVLISHWDLAKNPENEFKELCEIFGEEEICSNIICYKENCDYNRLAELMYSCSSNIISEMLELPNEDMFIKHNIPSIKGNIFKNYKDSKKEVDLIVKDFRSSLTDLPPEDRDEIIRILIIQMKYDLDEISNAFIKKSGDQMQEIEIYTFSIKMQKDNANYSNNFIQSVKGLMTYNMFDNKDPRNLIKRCPFCQTIWIKTEGCEGNTTCGNKSFSNYYDVSAKPMFAYSINRIKGEKVLWKKEAEKPKISLHKAVQGTNKVGCGKEITWSALPPIEESLILELFKI